jgi:hypothetical protein
MKVRAKEGAEWRTLTCERVRDGYYLYVAKASSGVRWRYSVTPLEYTQRPRRAAQWAKALGYARSYERAVRAAEVSCDALIKAEKDSKKRGESVIRVYEGET